MMNVLEEAKRALVVHPGARYTETESTVEVEPSSRNGFTVRIEAAAGEFVVSMDGWHEHFDTAEEAANCFAFALEPTTRLEVHERGGVPYRWSLQFAQDEYWVTESTTGLVFFPFWRRRRVRYLSNDFGGDS